MRCTHLSHNETYYSHKFGFMPRPLPQCFRYLQFVPLHFQSPIASHISPSWSPYVAAIWWASSSSPPVAHLVALDSVSDRRTGHRRAVGRLALCGRRLGGPVCGRPRCVVSRIYRRATELGGEITPLSCDADTRSSPPARAHTSLCRSRLRSSCWRRSRRALLARRGSSGRGLFR